MKIGNHLVECEPTGDGSLTFTFTSLNGDCDIDLKQANKAIVKYIKSRWPKERDWFLVEQVNNTVKFVKDVKYEDGKYIIGLKSYEVFIKNNKQENFTEQDIIVTHCGCSIRFSEIVLPILFRLNNPELFGMPHESIN